MQSFNNAVMFFLSFKPYVLLPVIIFILAIIFRIKLVVAIRSALTIGFGFIGIFMVFDFFIKIIHPVVSALILRTGLQMNVLDAGWPPLASVTWSFHLAPLLVALFLVINIVMLMTRLTKTVNIDIWNFWHVILLAAMIYFATKSALITIAVAAITFIVVLKLAEWSAPMVNRFSEMSGICIPHLSSITYFPIALLADHVFDRIPGLRRINANPETIQKTLGIAGEPMILGFVLGLLMGVGAGYDVKQTAELAFNFAAVTFILPKMGGILGSALIPVSEGMKEFIGKHFPKMGKTYIGLDVAVLFACPSVVSTTLLLTPFALILAFVLPGVTFIPLGDLTNLLVPVAMVTVATRGNIVRGFLVGIPMIIANLYIASSLAGFFTSLTAASNYRVADYTGTFTSFLDGGHVGRWWILKLASGEMIGFILLPVVVFLLYFTWRVTKKEGE
jgi:PTS system galactitol-specific IIC component